MMPAPGGINGSPMVRNCLGTLFQYWSGKLQRRVEGPGGNGLPGLLFLLLTNCVTVLCKLDSIVAQLGLNQKFQEDKHVLCLYPR